MPLLWLAYLICDQVWLPGRADVSSSAQHGAVSQDKCSARCALACTLSKVRVVFLTRAAEDNVSFGHYTCYTRRRMVFKSQRLLRNDMCAWTQVADCNWRVKQSLTCRKVMSGSSLKLHDALSGWWSWTSPHIKRRPGGVKPSAVDMCALTQMADCNYRDVQS